MSRASRNVTPSRLPSQHAYPNVARFPWAQTIVATLLAFLMFAGVASALMLADLDRQVKGAVLDTEDLGAADGMPVDSFEGRPVNILITGIDSRYGENEAVGAGTAEDEDTIRSDSTMIVHLSADRARTTVLSVPRDLMVDIPECVVADGSVMPEQYGQFNWAFSTGAVQDDLAGGIACVEATVEQLTGLDMDGFIIIDFAGFEKLINAMGGVELCIDEDMSDELAGLELSKGCHTLDGRQGLAFARARHDVGDGSDLQRIDRQQQLIGAMVAQALDSNIFSNMPQMYRFVQEAMQVAAFSRSLDTWRANSALLNSVRGTPPEDFRFVTVPWMYNPNDPNRVLLEEPAAGELFFSLVKDEPLPEGTIFRNLDNQTFIVGVGGEPVMIDEEGNPIKVTADGRVVPAPDREKLLPRNLPEREVFVEETPGEDPFFDGPLVEEPYVDDWASNEWE